LLPAEDRRSRGPVPVTSLRPAVKITQVSRPLVCLVTQRFDLGRPSGAGQATNACVLGVVWSKENCSVPDHDRGVPNGTVPHRDEMWPW
jgi:hypothetical protein